MNVEINSKLLEDSAKIEIGINYLQNQISYVINRYTEKNVDQKDALKKYTDDLAKIKSELVEYLGQQRELDKMMKEAESEMNVMQDNLETIIIENNIQIDPSNNNK